MFGLKDLSINRLAGGLLTVSAVLMVVAFAAPEDGSIATLIVWLSGALLILAVWALFVVETLKRYFGPTDSR